MIRVDSREQEGHDRQRPEIVALHNAPEPRCLLRYTLPENPDAIYSYDVEVGCEGSMLRGEIKLFSDMQASFFDGKLDRQLSQVDFFIVERNPMGELADMPEDEASRVQWKRNRENAERHLVTLSLALPVLQTTGIHGTVAALRHIEATCGGAKVRPNKVSRSNDSPRFALLGALPSINPHRPLKPDENGAALYKTLGEAIWGLYANPEAVLAALGVHEWRNLPGIGPGTVAKVEKAIRGSP